MGPAAPTGDAFSVGGRQAEMAQQLLVPIVDRVVGDMVPVVSVNDHQGRRAAKAALARPLARQERAY